MLISQNKVRKKNSEWQNLDNVEFSSTRKIKQNSINSNENHFKAIDEYGKLFGTIFAEYIKQVEIFSELQKSNTEIFANSFITTYNFFNLSIDAYRQLTLGFLKK